MGLKLITAPVSEPLTLTQAKAHLRILGEDDDTWLTLWLQVVREYAEHRIGRALMTQTWERTLDEFPEAILLSNPPVQSVTSITYIDADGESQTLASSAYSVDTDSEPCWILPAYGTDWPATYDIANAVRVRYVCGYTSADNVPAVIKAWMLVRLGGFYEYREAVSAGQVYALPRDHVDGLLDGVKIWGLA